METIKKLKIIIVILSVVLAISVCVLAVRFVQKAFFASDEATVKNNSLGSAEKSWSFGTPNFLPGDSETKDYTVTYYLNENANALFEVSADSDSKNLAQVITLKVVNSETGKVVCEGKLSDLLGKKFSDAISYGEKSKQDVTYRMTATLDPSAGNEYADAEIALRFRWSLESTGDGQ